MVTFVKWGCVAVINRDLILDPDGLYDVFQFLSVSACFFTAALFQKYILLKPEIFSGLDTLIFGGDKVNLKALRDYQNSRIPKPKYVLNGYGPTEATTFASVYPLNLNFSSSDEYLPIGVPLDHAEIYILDQYKNLQPIGVVGEIYIGGDGLALGYWKDKKLTEQSFIHGPFGTLLYKTGDLGYWNASGEIVFISRIDAQVKIRGYRIYPAQVEEQINQIIGVSQSAVISVKEEDREKLVAFIEPLSESSVDKEGYVKSWQTVYENLYSGLAAKNENKSYIGWKSSYDSKSIPDEEMSEWVDLTLSRLRPIKAKKILEIGVGTGLLAAELLKTSELYVGIDYSSEVIKYLEKTLAKQYSHLHLFCLSAEKLATIPFDDFDLIIINSVTQYFATLEDMNMVIHEGLKKLNKISGAFFIGDVRNYDLVNEFHATVLSKRLPNNTKVTDFRKKIDIAVRQEYELLISPAFFIKVSNENPSIKEVNLYIKHGKYENEMNCYRFDVLFSTKVSLATGEVRWLDWKSSPITPFVIEERIKKSRPNCIAIKNIFNGKLSHARSLMKFVEASESGIELGQIQFRDAAEGIDPSGFIDISLRHNYSFFTYVSYFPWEYDLILVDNTLIDREKYRKVQYELSARSMSNNPAHLILTPETLRSKLKDIMPNYMIPAQIEIIEHFPLTKTGKVDRVALYRMVTDLSVIKDKSSAIEPEYSEIELILLRIWKDVLKVTEINIFDNFFDLGGDSIITIHMVSQVVPHPPRGSLGIFPGIKVVKFLKRKDCV